MKSTQHFPCSRTENVPEVAQIPRHWNKVSISFLFLLLFFLKSLWKVTMQVRNQVNFIFHQVAKLGNTRQVPQLFTCCWKDSSLLETCHSYSQKADRIYPCKNYKLKKAHTIHLKVACFLFIPPKHSKIETEVHYRTYT